ncbi:hypothetical protein [Methylobacterium sp. PvR107]|uniref:hypothetical protein n=1 Tax=Methylobacterium sp. PvR107 TaxID=2806597 RepID=UPI001B615A88|nr:hypothetical protein [Methylobacterium sp. PvR107]MBP1179373.1 hypothetical protein [Methylobacterium sp. PvR107]
MALRSTPVRIAAPILLAACWVAPALAEPEGGVRPKMLVYGNYCGLGNNAPLPPIDLLDAACARHDDCTPDNDLPTKACNLRLKREATAIASDPRQPGDVRIMAGFVASFASNNASKVLPDLASVVVPAATLRAPKTYATLR